MCRLQRRTGDPGRAIILSETADTEGIERDTPRTPSATSSAAPGIARDADGASLADPEYITILPRQPKAWRAMTLLTLRGMGRKGLAVRPELKIVAGRMFRPGARELIIGIASQQQFRDLEVGDKVIMQDGNGRLSAASPPAAMSWKGRCIGDADTLMSAARRNNFNSVIVRLAGPDSLETSAAGAGGKSQAGGAGGTPVRIL